MQRFFFQFFWLLFRFLLRRTLILYLSISVSIPKWFQLNFFRFSFFWHLYPDVTHSVYISVTSLVTWRWIPCLSWVLLVPFEFVILFSLIFGSKSYFLSHQKILYNGKLVRTKDSGRKKEYNVWSDVTLVKEGRRT